MSAAVAQVDAALQLDDMDASAPHELVCPSLVHTHQTVPVTLFARIAIRLRPQKTLYNANDQATVLPQGNGLHSQDATAGLNALETTGETQP